MLYTKVRGALQRYAPATLKRTMWDREFRQGRWANLHLDHARYHHPELEACVAGGRVLDMGCGPGRTGLDLTPGTFSSYLGVDISQVAIDTARNAAQGRRDLHYAQGDLMTYVPPSPHDVILFTDSIYYVPVARLAALCTHYAPYLTDRGVLFVIVSDPEGRYQPLLAALREQGEIVKDTFITNDTGTQVYTLIVKPFRRVVERAAS